MRDMANEPKDQRIPLLMSASELEAVDDWAFARRIRSRGEAIRRLVRLGLEKGGEARGRADAGHDAASGAPGRPKNIDRP